MTERLWKSGDNEFRLCDMGTSHIVNSVAFLRRKAAERRALADMGAGDERSADKYLEWSLDWIKAFQGELRRRSVDNPLLLNDQRVTSTLIDEMLADPGEEDEIAPG